MSASSRQGDSEQRLTAPSFFTILWRGVRKKCPRCGKGEQFKTWFGLHDHCDSCDLQFEPRSGDSWGFWVIGDRLFIALAIILLYLGVRPESWTGRIAFLAFIAGGIVITMPHRQGVCTALDYYVRCRQGHD